jgi:hypothetical protein
MFLSEIPCQTTAITPKINAIASKLLSRGAKRGSRDSAKQRPAVMYKNRIVI